MRRKLTADGTAERYFGFLRRMKQPLLEPVLKCLAFCGVTADHLTWVGVGLAVIAALVTDPALLLALVVIDLLIDMVDGSLARHEHQESRAGTAFDISHDVFFTITSTFAMMRMGIAGPSEAYMYGVFYGMSVMFAIMREQMGIPQRFAVRPRLFVFAALALYVFTRVNVISELLLIGGALLGASCTLHLYRMLRKLRRQ
jgi:phosphatidylglycerophosphate synthase